MPTREECIARAGRALAQGRLTQAQMTPREQAEGAWSPTSPYTVDELEDLILVGRGLESMHLRGAALAELLGRAAARVAALRARVGGGEPTEGVNSVK